MELGQAMSRRSFDPRREAIPLQEQGMFLLPEDQCRTLQQELSLEEQERRKAGKLRRSLNIGDNDRKHPTQWKGQWKREPSDDGGRDRDYAIGCS